MEPRWFCKRCKKWHRGYPPLNCPSSKPSLNNDFKKVCPMCNGVGTEEDDTECILCWGSGEIWDKPIQKS